MIGLPPSAGNPDLVVAGLSFPPARGQTLSRCPLISDSVKAKMAAVGLHLIG